MNNLGMREFPSFFKGTADIELLRRLSTNKGNNQIEE